MTMQTDVKAKSVAGTGALGVGTGTGVRIKGAYFSMSTGGTVAITDGASTGASLLSLTVPIGTAYILIPGEGIWSKADPFVTYTTAVGALTIFYG
jgi:hypothetical protein